MSEQNNPTVCDYAGWKSMRELDAAVNVISVPDAEGLFRLFERSPFGGSEKNWIFRGHGDAAWRLQASIERVSAYPGVAADYAEQEFRRRAHHYLCDLPDDDNDLEWLALMQHHGAPTRLLDWTESPYIAAFFAAEERPTAPRRLAVWALDRDRVTMEGMAMLGFDRRLESPLVVRADVFKRFYREEQPEGLYLAMPFRPFRMNERLTLQQGWFVCGNHPLIGFDRCLKRVIDFAQERGSGQWLYRIEIESRHRLDVLSRLKKVNISRATLFPGLDGFARSIQASTEILWPKDNVAASDVVRSER